jgi:hypothetical protein
MPFNPLTNCLTAGTNYTNCDIRNYVRSYGLQLGCAGAGGMTYVADACNGQGHLVVGSSVINLGTVGGHPSKMVQRDAGGAAYATRFVAESSGCFQDSTGIYVGIGGFDHVRIGRNTPGTGFGAGLFLRGNGDVSQFNGTSAPSSFGGLAITRYPGLVERTEFTNFGSPHTGDALHMIFSTSNFGTGGLQPMMKLSPAAPRGTLYDTAWTYVSDATTKENIEDIEPGAAIEIVKMLRPRTFNVIGDAQQQAGYIAQEVEAIAPLSHLVSEVDTGQGSTLKSLRKDSIVDGYVAAAVKGLIEKVETLTSQLHEMQLRLDSLGAS